MAHGLLPRFYRSVAGPLAQVSGPGVISARTLYRLGITKTNASPLVEKLVKTLPEVM